MLCPQRGCSAPSPGVQPSVRVFSPHLWCSALSQGVLPSVTMFSPQPCYSALICGIHPLSVVFSPPPECSALSTAHLRAETKDPPQTPRCPSANRRHRAAHALNADHGDTSPHQAGCPRPPPEPTDKHWAGTQCLRAQGRVLACFLMPGARQAAVDIDKQESQKGCGLAQNFGQGQHCGGVCSL